MRKRRVAWAILVAVLVLLGLSSKPVQRWYYRVDHLPLILKSSKEHGMSPYLVAAVIFTESRFRSQAKSDVGAVGLMQLMPETAKDVAERMGHRGFHPNKLSEPELNITLGVVYLKELQERFPSPELALAAYNAGPTVVDGWGAEKEHIPYPETRSFVESVLRHEGRLQELYPQWTETEVDT